MNTYYLRLGRRLWIHDLVPMRIARHNLRAWVKALRERAGKPWGGVALLKSTCAQD